MAVSPLSCNTLLARCAKSDQAAFFQLYQHEAPSMLALATHMLGKRLDAENLVRDTLILIWKNADAWDADTGTARAWMHSILRYRALQYLAKGGRQQAASIARIRNLKNSQASGLMAASTFSSTLSTLGENQRHPLLMAFYQACTYPQMEQALQQSPAQLKKNLQLGLLALAPAVLGWTDHPTDRTLLIAEYTLGVLNPAETAQAQRFLGSDPQALIDALKWEQALLELTDRLAPAQLSDALWEDIALSLGINASHLAAYPLPLRPEQAVFDHSTPAQQTYTAAPVAVTTASPAITASKPIAPPTEPIATFTATNIPDSISATTTASTPPKPPSALVNTTSANTEKAQAKQRLHPQHLVLAAGLIAIAIIASRLIPSVPTAPPITVLAVAPTLAAILQAPGHSSTPAWVVTISPQGDVLLHPRVQTEVPERASVQLWTYSPSQPKPRSLGLIDPNLPVTVPASLIGVIDDDQMFEMTQEPEGGSASAEPSGPVLFIGQLVTFGQAMPVPQADADNNTSL
ncbi:anti-sigma factor [Alcaligenaceae bacterium]|nr:anti-sigma factor [Alcaligenaceae bacterium]